MAFSNAFHCQFFNLTVNNLVTNSYNDHCVMERCKGVVKPGFLVHVSSVIASHIISHKCLTFS